MTVLAMRRILSVIGSARCSLASEKETQADIAAALTAGDVPFEREYRLSSRDIVDFFAFEEVAIEVKMNGASPTHILKQLIRYGAHDRVQSVVLVTNRCVALPAVIAGKPAYYVSLGKAWL